VGRAVGAPFAVLVAEELFASGCQLLLQSHLSGSDYPCKAAPLLRRDRPLHPR
jgi:hypothetical protein